MCCCRIWNRNNFITRAFKKEQEGALTSQVTSRKFSQPSRL
jgi:hypothetical protein